MDGYFWDSYYALALHTLECLYHDSVTVMLKMIYQSNGIWAVLGLIKCPVSLYTFHMPFRNVFTRFGLTVPVLPKWWKCKMLIFYMHYLAYIYNAYLCTITKIIKFSPCYLDLYESSVCFHFCHWYLLSTTDASFLFIATLLILVFNNYLNMLVEDEVCEIFYWSISSAWVEVQLYGCMLWNTVIPCHISIESTFLSDTKAAFHIKNFNMYKSLL